MILLLISQSLFGLEIRQMIVAATIFRRCIVLSKFNTLARCCTRNDASGERQKQKKHCIQIYGFFAGIQVYDLLCGLAIYSFHFIWYAHSEMDPTD